MASQMITSQQNSRYQFDLDADEWYAECGACGYILYAPTKADIAANYLHHTRSTGCLGGY